MDEASEQAIDAESEALTEVADAELDEEERALLAAEASETDVSSVLSVSEPEPDKESDAAGESEGDGEADTSGDSEDADNDEDDEDYDDAPDEDDAEPEIADSRDDRPLPGHQYYLPPQVNHPNGPWGDAPMQSRTNN